MLNIKLPLSIRWILFVYFAAVAVIYGCRDLVSIQPHLLIFHSHLQIPHLNHTFMLQNVNPFTITSHLSPATDGVINELLVNRFVSPT